MRDHVTPILKALHWLPITQRVEYKILVLTHKCIYEKSAPEYLEKLLLLGPLCYKLITIVNCYLETGLSCIVY